MSDKRGYGSADIDLAALVQAIAEHGCQLTLEYDGYEYRAGAFGAMPGEQLRPLIDATAGTVEGALALLAYAVEKAEWVTGRGRL